MAAIQPPNGTRDFYPEEALRRRYITEAWRATSLRHGFEEIDGPTFEHLDLYTVKSGEGIVSELFSFERFGGEKKFALRPEFTPTLARMYAAKAASLPKPTKWFMAGPFFRAERPQRGRLREFLQWNCDILGLDVEWGATGTPAANTPTAPIASSTDTSRSEPWEILKSKARADAEVIACCIELLKKMGLDSSRVRIKLNHRWLTESLLLYAGVGERKLGEWFTLIDRIPKLSEPDYLELALRIGSNEPTARIVRQAIKDSQRNPSGFNEVDPDLLHTWLFAESLARSEIRTRNISENRWNEASRYVNRLRQELLHSGVHDWVDLDSSIVRGLAYYTGMVFEVIVDGERAVAGGGRYDNLIELFGGPSTPAVGFGMGDVVLSLVLKDKGLLPEGKELADLLDSPRCRASVRPDVFVISNGQPECDALVPTLLSQARARGLHARRSYKTTKKIAKLLADAAAQHARHAIIIETPESCTLKNLDTQTQESLSFAAALDRLAPSSR
ncbi:MAG: ATP phosphoribosyltransferase regulatory subunit [Phycisphaeraceae bacterium]|nr:ATP phosphoribosyltransferase regulatory subunit [Phycisphaeraceae bacterium]MCW5754520.1 ATP phosphoribosyltransferase regulatory subunit [Phycisphaeraceae bacterium]